MSRPEGVRGLREFVLGVLVRARGGGFVGEVLEREFEHRRFPAGLRAAASELASGVVRRRITLDYLIGVFSDRPVGRIDRTLLDILRIALYEILFVEKVPVHASVDEAVALTRKRVRPEVAGFANAVLRGLTRAVESERCAASGRATGELPVAPGVVVRFNRDVFPDPATDPGGYLAASGGMPAWLVERWLSRFGPDATDGIVEASNARPPVTVRVNTLSTTREKLAAGLAASDVRTSPGALEECLHVDSPVELTALDVFKAGAFYIQDESAMHAARMLTPRAGERVLDLCAAPGGKTTHLAALSGDAAEITAVDSSAGRLGRVVENATRLGIRSIRTLEADARRLPDDLAGGFDAVLADVPCSNTGVLRRRVEARHRLSPDVVRELARVQTDILHAAIRTSRPGGRVVYSTCSIEDEENAAVVRTVLETHPGCRLDDEKQWLPSASGADGGYVARLLLP
ncbi:MAG TPA: 16S rRNA (cytosine(967)-C(5))-methyltransferase RsmB [Planctomycetota bacterium]|nr:16S rRNA (cytosine(967)-C(5))-methyltransferase RsmB [Planctomycetota bacterium]